MTSWRQPSNVNMTIIQSSALPCLRRKLENCSTERQQRSITTAPLIIPTCLSSRNELSYVTNMFILVEDLELFIRSVCVNDFYGQLKRWTLAATVHNEQQKRAWKQQKLIGNCYVNNFELRTIFVCSKAQVLITSKIYVNLDTDYVLCHIWYKKKPCNYIFMRYEHLKGHRQRIQHSIHPSELINSHQTVKTNVENSSI